MIKVNVKKQSSYPVSSPKLKAALRDFLKEKGIVSDSEISVAIVGLKKMKDLGRSYLGEKDSPPHNVLSFTESEAKEDFKNPPGSSIQLGEIVLCFPVIREEAKKEGKLIDERAIELVRHGALHLLGIHHK